MTHKEQLFDASTTIYKEIEKLRRGLPIAEAKARNQLKRLEIRKEYTAKIKALDMQYKAIATAMRSAE